MIQNEILCSKPFARASCHHCCNVVIVQEVGLNGFDTCTSSLSLETGHNVRSQ